MSNNSPSTDNVDPNKSLSVVANGTATTPNIDLPSTSSNSSSKTSSTGTPSPSLERKIQDALANSNYLKDSSPSKPPKEEESSFVV
jgi:hypothetical protein